MAELEQFTPGFRTIDGTQLNTIVDVVNGITGQGGEAAQPIAAAALTASSAAIAGNATISGFLAQGVQVAAAAGSNSQANATTITESVCVVTTVSSTTRGIKLPVAVTGRVVEIHNAGATQVKPYPNTGARIGAAATNAAGTAIAKQKGSIFRAQNTTTWRVIAGA